MCFDPFPFPAVSDEGLKDRIRTEAEALDVLHRDIVTAGLTLTQVYNVIDALNEVRTGKRSLTDSERDTYERGLVSVVAQRLAEIDRLVALAYGWEGELRIPTQSGQGFRFDVGHRSDLIPATIPK